MSTKGSAGAEAGKNVMIQSGSYRGDCATGAHSAELSPKRLRYRGMGLVWTAIFLMLMILLMGLSLDTGKVAYNLHQLQNAADAAALAGAQTVKIASADATRQRAYDLGFANAAEGLAVTLRMDPQDEPWIGNWNSFDILLGRWVRYNRTFVPTLDAPNAVMAIPRRNTALGATAPALSLTFGPMAGVDTSDAERVAVAFCNSSGGAGLIVLSPTAVPGLTFTGTADLDIDGGGIHVNSTALGNNNSAAAWVSGGALIDAGFFNVVGAVTPDPDDSAWESNFLGGDDGVNGFPVMDYEDGVQHIPDPLAAELIGHPYVDAATGTHLNLPALLQGAEPTVPTWYAHWNGSSYDLVDDPDNPSMYMSWNDSTSSYDSVEFDPADVDPGLFRDTVGLQTEKVAITDPDTGLPVLDPITGLPTYTYISGNVNATATLPSGYYPNGMSLGNGDDITLRPGATTAQKLFLFGGGTNPTNNNVGLYMTAGTLTGDGVTCYVTKTYDTTGTDTGVCGLLRITGGTVEISSPGDYYNQEYGGTPEEKLERVQGFDGIAIWEDPTMMTSLTEGRPDGPPDAHLNGNGDFSLSGTVYLPDPIHLFLNGTLGDTGNQVLCGSAEISGRAEIRVNYDGRNRGISPAISCLVL